MKKTKHGKQYIIIAQLFLIPSYPIRLQHKFKFGLSGFI
jgi:hypothetical protein